MVNMQVPAVLDDEIASCLKDRIHSGEKRFLPKLRGRLPDLMRERGGCTGRRWGVSALGEVEEGEKWKNGLYQSCR